jgi:condensation domain-containing protein
MFDQVGRDQVALRFAGEAAGTGLLTWGQKAILQDMRDSGGQFSMAGMIELPPGSTVEDAALRVSQLMGRHAALRVRLGVDDAGRPCQEVAGSGRTSLDVLTVPDDAGPADVAGYLADLLATWPLTRFDFHRDWPLRAAVVKRGDACLNLVWVLSHLVADGGAHLLLLEDLFSAGTGGPPRPQILDIARSEQERQLRQLSARAMPYWEAQLADIPARTFGEPVRPAQPAGERYQQVRFTSPAAQLAVAAIARRTGTDVSRATLAVIATAIARVTGLTPLTIKVMVNNRFRPGLAEVIAPIAQNSVITVDVGDASVDEVVARVRGASMTAAMRAYYDPDDLSELTARLDARRGYPATVTCRVNDQRRMVMRGKAQPADGELSAEHVRQRLEETSLTWLGTKADGHEQVNILVENRSDALSLRLLWDAWSLSNGQVEALLRGVEEVAVAAAADPAAPTAVAAPG